LSWRRHEIGHVLHAVVELGREAEGFDLHGALAELLGHVAGALEIARHLHGGDHHAQVRRHRLAAGDHRDREIVDAVLHLVDLLVGGANLDGKPRGSA
jgi:hypothetical protein